MTSFRNRGSKPFWTTFIKHSAVTIKWGYYNLLSPLSYKWRKSWFLIWCICNRNLSFNIYIISGYWIQCIFFYYKWWCFRYMFFFRNWVSWLTRDNWNNFFGGSFVKNICLPSNWQSSLGFWGRYSLLTFCGCSLTFFICIYLLLGFLNLINNIIKEGVAALALALDDFFLTQ